LALDSTAPFHKKLDEGVAKWQEWCQEHEETGPATYVVEETRSAEELQAEQDISERILRYLLRISIYDTFVVMPFRCPPLSPLNV
jgi:hypothetical protein